MRDLINKAAAEGKQVMVGTMVLVPTNSLVLVIRRADGKSFDNPNEGGYVVQDVKIEMAGHEISDLGLATGMTRAALTRTFYLINNANLTLVGTDAGQH